MWWTVMLAKIFVGSTNFYKNLFPHNSAGVFLFNINGAARKQTRNTVLITTQWTKLRIWHKVLGSGKLLKFNMSSSLFLSAYTRLLLCRECIPIFVLSRIIDCTWISCAIQNMLPTLKNQKKPFKAGSSYRLNNIVVKKWEPRPMFHIP